MILIANLSDDESKNKLDDLNEYSKTNQISIISAVIKVEHELTSVPDLL